MAAWARKCLIALQRNLNSSIAFDHIFLMLFAWLIGKGKFTDVDLFDLKRFFLVQFLILFSYSFCWLAMCKSVHVIYLRMNKCTHSRKELHVLEAEDLLFILQWNLCACGAVKVALNIWGELSSFATILYRSIL